MAVMAIRTAVVHLSHAFGTMALLVALPHDIAAEHAIPDRPRIVLAVCNEAAVTASILSLARQTTEGVFDRARIGVTWVPCGHAAAKTVEGAALIVQALLATDQHGASRAAPPRILGMVVRGDGAEEGIWALTSRIVRAAAQQHVDAGFVLGSVIAHEIGHLLLPRRQHSDGGLMVVAWTHDDFVRASQGILQFAAADAVRLRASLRDRQPAFDTVTARVH
jgi:hypothetical protein